MTEPDRAEPSNRPLRQAVPVEVEAGLWQLILLLLLGRESLMGRGYEEEDGDRREDSHDS
ncbi:MAG: hypothetical protein IH987_07090 [Planctomycetes bacterium]|nr:hypothetical protein [Planctomycetota bacterium]